MEVEVVVVELREWEVAVVPDLAWEWWVVAARDLAWRVVAARDLTWRVVAARDLTWEWLVAARDLACQLSVPMFQICLGLLRCPHLEMQMQDPQWGTQVAWRDQEARAI